MREWISTFLTTLSVLALVLLGVAIYYADGKFGKSGCEMSYMHPIFMENWPPLIRGEDPHVEGLKRCERTRYRVLRYFEAKVANDYQKPNGHPVLFVPGHLGSFQQARTLGSQVGGDVTVYAIDFLSQPAGLAGSLLRRQAEFVNEAAYAISRLHEGKPLVIVGHSMGAVAAWGSQFLPVHHPVKVSAFFSICAPLNRPILLAENSMYEFYDRMHAGRNSSTISETVLISLSCGRRDALVPSSLCAAGKIFADPTRVIHTPASNLSGFSVDHQAVLWCNPIASKIAQAVTKAAGLTTSGLSPQQRRREIARTLFSRAADAEDLTPGEYLELEQRMIDSEKPRPRRRFGVTLWTIIDDAINYLVMAFRPNWTRLVAFAFASGCLMSFEASRRAHANLRSSAEAFVDRAAKIVEHEEETSSWAGLARELELGSVWHQIKCIKDISFPTLPLFVALFVQASLRDDEREFVNLWFFFASQAMLQILFVVIHFLRRRTFLQRLGRQERFVRRTLFAIWVVSTAGLYAVFKPVTSENFAYDVSHLLLCILYLTTFMVSVLAALWVIFCWGGSLDFVHRAEDVRFGIFFGLFHIASICDTLGAALLALDAIMMSAPWSPYTEERGVIPTPFPSPKSATSHCKQRLDELEVDTIEKNFTLLVPWFLCFYRLCTLQREPKFVLVQGEWGEFEFSGPAASVGDSKPSRSQKKQRKDTANGGTRDHRTAQSRSKETTVDLVPCKTSKGKEQFVEILADVEYDDSEPSVLIEFDSGDIVQVDTLKVQKDSSKDDDAEVLHIGRDVNLAERRRKWSRPYHARVRVNQVVSKYPLTAILQLGSGMFFAAHSDQLIWIFPCCCVLFTWFALSNFWVNRRQRREELEITRYLHST